MIDFVLVESRRCSTCLNDYRSRNNESQIKYLYMAVISNEKNVTHHNNKLIDQSE